MAQLRFTDRWLSSCTPPLRGRLEFADALCPGLRARVTARGKKSFSVVLWVNRRQQRRTIGQYPRVSLADARSRTLEMLRAAAEGVDPREQLAGAESPLTFAELVDQYTELHLKPNTRSGRDIRITEISSPTPRSAEKLSTTWKPIVRKRS